MIKSKIISCFIVVSLYCLVNVGCISANIELDKIDKEIKKYMLKGDIPGLSLVIIKNNQEIIKNYGYADLEMRKKVSNETLFQLGSCSKAFTALAILKLEEEKKLHLNDKLSDYIPWFKTYYKDSLADIKLSQLLHHTSGIPWYTISLIPESGNSDALEQTVRRINNITLHNSPGKRYEYATINYDILALIVQYLTGETFETYLNQFLAKDLGLIRTRVGEPYDKNEMAHGYKIGFMKPIKYNAPVYKGNNAAGYVISNANDMLLWLRYQMNLVSTKFDLILLKSHVKDESVMPHDLNSYAFGWNVSLRGDGLIYHDGLNPNYSSYIGFCKNDKIGVVVLTNSNSQYTYLIGKNVIKILNGEKVSDTYKPDTSNDKAFLVISIIMGIFVVFVFIFLIYIIYGIIKGKRIYAPLTLKKIVTIVSIGLFILPFIYGIYILPQAIAGFSWNAAIVWSPISFPVAVILILISIVLSYITFIVSNIFPEQNKYLRNFPQIILLSVLSGLSNMIVILLVTSSLKNNMDLKFVLYYFIITMVVYLLGRKTVQTKMIYLTRDIIYDLRMKIIQKVFSTSYEKFEKIDRGRVYSTMNDDIGTIGESANTFVNITTSIITAGGAFLYMATLAFWATLLTILLVSIISTIYFIVSRKTRVLFEDARETRSVYMRLLNGMIDGFKELSIHKLKKLEYKNDIEISTDEFRKKISLAHVKFVNAFIIGESLLILVLAIVTFAIPTIFPEIEFYTILSFIIILLYLIGPVNNILGAIPNLMQLKIAWKRVQSFINDIPANLDLNEIKEVTDKEKVIYSFKAKSLLYKYNDDNNKSGFSVGPIDLEVKQGEALFIIGGNGSGKTTLAKLLTGLYTAQEGDLLINNKIVNPNEIGEFFSTVFNPFHLFQKLYNMELSDPKKQLLLNNLLKILQLEEKVMIRDNEYSTINLSGGQRKRLAMLQCYLEDRPIYLFDEWAADQDPEYRRFFYRDLLVKMKQQGKIIIAITHDDHYFDIADKILKLDMGKVEYLLNTKKPEKSI